MIMTPSIDSQDRCLMNGDIIQTNFLIDFFVIYTVHYELNTNKL